MSEKNKKYRLHGSPPYKAVLVHGGPGAAGELEYLSKILSKKINVIEPFQRADSITGQIEELVDTIKKTADPPITILGFSWGAWLSWLTASSYPELFSKVILVSSPPFEERASLSIMGRRMSRLSLEERKEVKRIKSVLFSENMEHDLFRRFAYLMEKADSFDRIENLERPVLELDPAINSKVWKEAVSLRRSGKLLMSGKSITGSVTIIHGDQDPHPFEGVKVPINTIIPNPTIHLLRNCGHRPWTEKHARDEFLQILDLELTI